MKKRRLLVASDDPALLARIAATLAGDDVLVLRSSSLEDDLVALAQDAGPDAIVVAGGSTEASYSAYRRLRRSPELGRTAVIVRAPLPETSSGLVPARGSRDAFFALDEPDARLRAFVLDRASRPRRILVADDEPLLRRMYESYLTNEGYEVVSASDGGEAIDRARSELPDLVITDVKMPRADGYEVCRSLKENKETRHLPVVIVSALGGDFDVNKGFTSGANEYLTKPVDLEELRERIESIFRGIEVRGRETVLLVVPDGVERSALEYGLSQQGFEAIGASEGEEALVLAREVAPSIVVCDAQLPGIDTPAFVARLRMLVGLRDIPLVLIAGKTARVSRDARKAIAATSFLTKPYSIDRLVAIIERTLGERRVKAASELEMVLQMVASLAEALEAKDAYTRGHSDKVARYSRLLAKQMGLNREQVQEVRLAAQLHDIGKIGIRDSVLLKPGSLDEIEWKIMQKHPTIGGDIMKPIARLRDIAPMVRGHHERFDGKGYPDGLGGREIPLGARIIACADTYDSCTSTRPYRRGMEPARAFAILKECAGSQLDPEIVDAMLALQPRLSSPWALRELSEEEAHDALHHDGVGGHRHDHDGLGPDGHSHVAPRPRG